MQAQGYFSQLIISYVFLIISYKQHILNAEKEVALAKTELEYVMFLSIHLPRCSVLPF